MFVEELKGFPFPTFREYRTACLVGIAVPSVDPYVGINWLMRVNTPNKRMARFSTHLALWVPWLIIAYLLIYFAINNWWLFLGIPVIGITFYVTSPPLATRNTMGPLISLFLLIITVLFVYSLWNGEYPGLARLSGGCLLMAALNKLFSSIMIKTIVRSAAANEESLCELWNGGAVAVMMADGGLYSYRRSLHEQEKGEL